MKKIYAKKKQLLEKITASDCERKTGLKPATPSLEG